MGFVDLLIVVYPCNPKDRETRRGGVFFFSSAASKQDGLSSRSHSYAHPLLMSLDYYLRQSVVKWAMTVNQNKTECSERVLQGV